MPFVYYFLIFFFIMMVFFLASRANIITMIFLITLRIFNQKLKSLKFRIVSLFLVLILFFAASQNKRVRLSFEKMAHIQNTDTKTFSEEAPARIILWKSAACLTPPMIWISRCTMTATAISATRARTRLISAAGPLVKTPSPHSRWPS